VIQLRQQEQTLLESYKEFLTILETFSKVKTSKLTKDERAVFNYDRLKLLSAQCFCRLFERHPHFNYRVNILQMICSKLSTQAKEIRRVCTSAIKGLLRKDDNQLLEFKLDILKELHKSIKAKAHNLFDPTLLDCLVLHEIMVDEGKARAVD
jgi:nucleolar complex protein 3